ncbi:MAG: HAD-IA family hydrolase [Candidatus Woesearchaeota archaeon]
MIEKLRERVLENSSHTFRTAKPHKKLFQIALQKIHAQPQNCILIDDKPAYIATAKALGIHTCLYQNNAQTIKEINHWIKN